MISQCSAIRIRLPTCISSLPTRVLPVKPILRTCGQKRRWQERRGQLFNRRSWSYCCSQQSSSMVQCAENAADRGATGSTHHL